MRYRQLTSPITFGITQSIVGVDGGFSTPLPPLDNVSAWLAISISRKLRTAYTGSAIRLRRDSDNAELNIGFNPQGGLDTAAVTAWLGAANGFIVTLYDQSGNNRNYTQTVAANQPAFVLSSGLKNRPAASFNGTSHSITDSNVLQDTTLRDWMGLAAIKPAVTTGGTDVVFSSRPFNAEDWAFCSLTNVNNLGYAQGAGMAAYYPTALGALPGTLNAQQVAWVMQAPNAGRIRRNGVDVVTGLTSSTRRFAASTIFGQEHSGGAYYNGELAEFVLLEGSAKFAAAETLAYEANSQAYHV